MYLNQINTFKCEIEEIYNKKAIGCIIRSRCKFIDEYERPSRYFLHLEKVVQKVKHIRCLVVGGKRICNPVEIPKAQSDLYAKLYYVDSNSILDNLDYERFLTDIKTLIFPVYQGNIKLNGIEKSGKTKCVKQYKICPTIKVQGQMAFQLNFTNIFGTVFQKFFLIVSENHLRLDNYLLVRKKGVITLIPQKDKDLRELKSWQPLSLLNTDYKISVKILAKILKVETIV